MTVITENRIAGVVRAAESVLSIRAGSTVILADPEDLGGSGRTIVVRVRVLDNPLSMDRTLVIKALPDDEDPSAFHREMASYKYATALPTESRPGPQLIASDPEARLLVLSDLGHGRPMTSLLSGLDPVETAHAVSAWGQALGRMHAATVGGENDYRALLRRGSAAAGETDLLGEAVLRAVAESTALTAGIGVTVPEDIRERLIAACSLFTYGDHRAFSPSDVGPENILINGDGVQFMDYEWGGFRDASLDIAYALVTLGTQVQSDHVNLTELEIAMVDAWHSEVRSIWPSLGHANTARAILTARLLWVWLSTIWLLPADDGDAGADLGQMTTAGYSHEWALHSNDPRVVVARWTELSKAAAGVGEPKVAEFAQGFASTLHDLWLN